MQPSLTLQGGCSYSDTTKMRLPFKGTFSPTYRSIDPVLTSELPFEVIEARSLFVYMSAMRPCPPVFVGSPSPSSGNGFPGDGLWWGNTDHLAQGKVCLCGPLWANWVPLGRCHGWHVNKKAPHLDAFKWQLRCQYWIKWSVTWWEYSFKWQIYFNIVKIGTQGLITKPQGVIVFKGRATGATWLAVFVDSDNVRTQINVWGIREWLW